MAQRILLLGGAFFLISLFVDVLSVDVLGRSTRPGTTLTRRSIESYIATGLESLVFGVVVHYLEEKTNVLAFDPSE